MNDETDGRNAVYGDATCDTCLHRRRDLCTEGRPTPGPAGGVGSFPYVAKGMVCGRHPDVQRRLRALLEGDAPPPPAKPKTKAKPKAKTKAKARPKSKAQPASS